ncbi:MAG: hypothetical protein M3N91_13450 [Pseudomonadota bacterium]|nr:hypothetical protein [Pseudomonadota bacterium]
MAVSPGGIDGLEGTKGSSALEAAYTLEQITGIQNHGPKKTAQADGRE